MAPHLEMLTVAVAASILARSYTDYSLGHVSTAVVLFVVQFLLYQAYSIIIWPHFVSCHRHLPQPPNNHWFWGQTKRILAEPSGVPMQDWVRNVPNTGLIRYSVWFQQRLLVTSPAALADVLVTKNYDFVKPWHIRTGLGRILGRGILVAEGEEHKVQRKNLSPAFSFRHVKDIYPIFWRKSREMVDCVAAAAASPPTEAAAAAKHISDTDHVDVRKAAQSHVNGAVDVGNWTSRATLDIIGLSGMGRDFDSLHDPDNELTRTYRTVFNPGRAGRILQVAGIFVPFWIMKRLPIKRNRELDDASAYIKQVCRDAIGKKRENMAGGKSHDVDILSVALQSGAFTDEDLVNQMMTFLGESSPAFPVRLRQRSMMPKKKKKKTRIY
jgi:cytochrome P450